MAHRGAERWIDGKLDSVNARQFGHRGIKASPWGHSLLRTRWTDLDSYTGYYNIRAVVGLLEASVRPFRRQRWLAFMGFAALVIQLAATFGHHHAHLPPAPSVHFLASIVDHARALDASLQGGSHHHGPGHLDHGVGNSPRTAQHHPGPTQDPAHDDEDNCQTCQSIGSHAGLILPEQTAELRGFWPSTPVFFAADTSGHSLYLRRAHLPRGPPRSLKI